MFDRLAALVFSGAVFNICNIVLGSQPSASQELAVIPAELRRHVIETGDEN